MSLYPDPYIKPASSGTQSLDLSGNDLSLTPSGNTVNLESIIPSNSQKMGYSSGLNITTIDGDLQMTNGNIDATGQEITCDTLNYTTLNPPVTTAISGIIYNGPITIETTATVPNDTITLDGNVIQQNGVLTLNSDYVNVTTSDGVSLYASGGGGGGQQLKQYPLVPLGSNEYYNQSWNGIGGLGTKFEAGTVNFGSYHIKSADGTVVVDDGLSVSGGLELPGISSAVSSNLLVFDSATKIVGYAPYTPPALSVVAVSSTPIDLSANNLGRIYVLTGTTPTQAFTTSTLGVGDAGFYVVVHNGNGVNGGDITLSGMTGTNVVHERTNTRNNGSAYLYWDGTALIGY